MMQGVETASYDACLYTETLLLTKGAAINSPTARAIVSLPSPAWPAGWCCATAAVLLPPLPRPLPAAFCPSPSARGAAAGRCHGSLRPCPATGTASCQPAYRASLPSCPRAVAAAGRRAFLPGRRRHELLLWSGQPH